MQYAYPHFRRQVLVEDSSFRSGPGPGELFPDFQLKTTRGGYIRNRDFTGKGPFLLTLGSFS